MVTVTVTVTVKVTAYLLTHWCYDACQARGVCTGAVSGCFVVNSKKNLKVYVYVYAYYIYMYKHADMYGCTTFLLVLLKVKSYDQKRERESVCI